MKLPEMGFSDKIKTAVQTEFGGYDHRIAAGDGSIWDETNMSSRRWPLLAPREKRRTYRTLTTPNGMFGYDRLIWADGTGLYDNGTVVGSVANSRKIFCQMSGRILIWPDKKVYNTKDGTLKSIESTWSGASLTFKDGTLYEEAAEANTIYCSGVNWGQYFQEGDAVTISGCTQFTENNKTPIIREIDGAEMRFYENVFKLPEGQTSYSETGAMKIERTAPDLDWMCTNDNRAWGGKEDTVWCCKLGDPFNWNVFDGISTDAWSVETGTPGEITGCASFLGYPIFFKENSITKVYGDEPDYYELSGGPDLGIAPGSGRSFAIAGEIGYFMTRAGIAAYRGGIPTLISAAFGEDRYKNAVGGSDGRAYWVSMQKKSDSSWSLFCFDPEAGAWIREDNTQVLDFANVGGNLYALTAAGSIIMLGNIQDPPAGTTQENDVSWSVEFGDFTDRSPSAKTLHKITVRYRMENQKTMKVYALYEGQNNWTEIASVTGDGSKESRYLPIIPRRMDNYRLKFTGTGDGEIYSIAREYYEGSPNRTRSR